MNFGKYVRRVPTRAVSALIQVYRYGISPVLPARCRYAPTCSEYALEAVRRHGALRGSRLALGRIFRCHPWGGCGYDPVPCAHGPETGRASAPIQEA